MQLPLLWVPQENLSWYSALNIYHKVTIAIKCRLTDDYFVPKFVDIEPGLLELFGNVTGVRFFLRHSVDIFSLSSGYCYFLCNSYF